MKEKRLVIVICLFVAAAFVIELNMVKIAIDDNYYKNAYFQQYKELQVSDARGVITDINFNNITNSTTQLKTLVTVHDKDLQQIFNALTEKEKQNFYENMDRAEPSLRPVLSKFGIYLNGPCEVMPFEPTLVAACYRVTGRIVNRGESSLHINAVQLRPEEADDTTFFLWIGPVELPWTQEEDMDEVLSPANQPEFMDRMMARLLKWADDTPITS